MLSDRRDGDFNGLVSLREVILCLIAFEVGDQAVITL